MLLAMADAAAHRTRTHFSTILKDLLMLLSYAVVLIAVLTKDTHVDPTPILASSAVIGVVLGFALQESLGNIFSGLTLQMSRPFAPGDWVRSGYLRRPRSRYHIGARPRSLRAITSGSKFPIPTSPSRS